MKTLDLLRQQGWRVAIHNDYTIDGALHTFWLLTHPSGRWIKGEGMSDTEALDRAEIMRQKTDLAVELAKALESVHRELWVDECLARGRTDSPEGEWAHKPAIRIIKTALASAIEVGLIPKEMA